MLRIKPKALSIVGKHCTTEVHPYPSRRLTTNNKNELLNHIPGLNMSNIAVRRILQMFYKFNGNYVN
jgi:hypothetical protein